MPMAIRPSRRTFLLTAAGAAAVGVGGAAALDRSDFPLRHWIARIVRDNLPGISIGDATLEAYVADVLVDPVASSKLTRLAALANLVAPDIHAANDYLARRVDDFERNIVSGFLMNSNFFEIENIHGEEIVYEGGRAPCTNPFAVLT